MPEFIHSERSPKALKSTRQKARRLLFEDLELRQLMAILGLGVAGDSWSDDQYAGQNYDPNGTVNFAQNWVDLLRLKKGVDVGSPGPFLPTTENPFEHRGQGTAFNWASSVSTTLELLLQSQDIGIIDQYAEGDLSHAVLMVGNIDLQPNSRTTLSNDDFKDAYAKIYLGEYQNASEIDQYVIQAITSNIEGALSTLTSVATKTILTTIPDPGVTPHARAEFPDASKRGLVTAVINTINTRIKQIGAKYHVPVVDLAKLSETIFGTSLAPITTRNIGGRIFDNAAGNAKTNLFVNEVGTTNEANLPHTVYQAYIANAIMEGLNVGYGENLTKFTEQEIVTMAGQTYGGTNTFPVNYRSLVTLPPVTVFVDFGKDSSPSDDFNERMREVATARGIPQLSSTTGGELATLKANILTRLQNAFPGVTINFTSVAPGDTRFETIKVGKISASVPGALTSPLGQGEFDWLNINEASIGHVFPDLIKQSLDGLNLSTLTRANQLRFLENILTFYIAQEAGRGLGLSSSDAYGYSQITSANYANTGGVQYQDFMSGDPALGFSMSTFNGTPTFKFSPLALAKLQMGHWLNTSTIATVPEVGTAHATTATAQVVPLTTTSGSASFKVGVVQGATIGVGGQKDLYKLTLAANDKITAQTFATEVYGETVPLAIDTVIKIFAADGTTLLYESDNTLLGNNSIGQNGTTKVDDDSFVTNFVVATAGDYYVEVTAKSGATGTYDLLLGATLNNAFPWQNPTNALNVNNSTGNNVITAFDALEIINELNSPRIADPITKLLPAPGPSGPPPYLDVFADGRVTAFDALPIINYLNANPVGSVVAPEFVPSAGEDTSSFDVAPGLLSNSSTNSGSAGEETSANQVFLPLDPAAELLLLNSYVASNSSGEDIEVSHSEAADIALAELLAEAE
ncbi:Dockerin type I repeat protein [Anatilimnocola aggregata]|uniref:Dockerin type I repeat protein n=1 Tax=Anatilimnocola aggregata TaxID=2528021 RepID=A0A517YNV7_9BACT|nr:dockerin type I domain-containing protein [Anatilimnocola aggregata]QDU31915.1 Dockerin type I repeat protein [Anatilimnocola aggregata]